MALDINIPNIFRLRDIEKYKNICTDCGGRYGKWSRAGDITHEQRNCLKCGKCQIRKIEIMTE